MAIYWGNDQLYDIYQNKLDFDIKDRGLMDTDSIVRMNQDRPTSPDQEYDSTANVIAGTKAWNLNNGAQQDFLLFDDANSYNDLCTEVEAVQDK